MAEMLWREGNQIQWVGCRPAHKGTQVYEYGAVMNGTITLYTVPAASTLYLTTVMFGTVAPTTFFGRIYTDNGGGGAQKDLITTYFVAAVSHIGQNLNFWPPLEIPAAYRVRVHSGGAGLSIRGTIHGWVEAD